MIFYDILSLTCLIKLKMDELRHTIISETEILATKSRFGLFSQPPPLAIGDEPVFKQKQGTSVAIQPGAGKTGGR